MEAKVKVHTQPKTPHPSMMNTAQDHKIMDRYNENVHRSVSLNIHSFSMIVGL